MATVSAYPHIAVNRLPRQLTGRCCLGRRLMQMYSDAKEDRGQMKAVVAGLLLLVPPPSGEPLGGRVELSNVVAAPEIVMLHGGSLRERVVIADWSTNHRLLAGLVPQASVPESVLRNRPYFDVALFWGTEWKSHSESPERLRSLQPTQGNQFARLYPAHGKAPALFVFRAGLAGMVPRAPYRSVSPDARDLLAKYGVRLRPADR